MPKVGPVEQNVLWCLPPLKKIGWRVVVSEWCDGKGKSSTCWAVNFSNSPDYLIWRFGEPNLSSPFVNTIQTMNIIQILASPWQPFLIILSVIYLVTWQLSYNNVELTFWTWKPFIFWYPFMQLSEFISQIRIQAIQKRLLFLWMYFKLYGHIPTLHRASLNRYTPKFRGTPKVDLVSKAWPAGPPEVRWCRFLSVQKGRV